MATYTLRRILQMLPLLLLISLIIYALTALQPGDPVDQLTLGNSQITPADIVRLKAAYGLDQPIYLRYFYWLVQALHGDFGWSRSFSAPAGLYVFQERLPNTLLLTVPALIIALLIAVPLGIYSAVRQYSLADSVLTFFSFVAFSTPVFWLGPMVLWLFAIYLPQMTGGVISLPPGGLGDPNLDPATAGFWPLLLDKLKYLALPLAVLALREIAVILRFMRASMLEVMNLDYVRTARAKGLPIRSVVYKHALRNAVIPIITLLSLAIPGLFGGAVITETVFSWPGMGRAILEGLVNKDFNVVLAALTFIALLTLIFSLLADLAYAAVDPRIRYDRQHCRSSPRRSAGLLDRTGSRPLLFTGPPMTAVPVVIKPAVGRSAWAVSLRRFRRHRLAMFFLVVIGLLIFMALAAPLIAPYNPETQDLSGFYEPPSAAHLFGKDDLGRDILSRIIWGSRISLLVGFSVAALGILIGTVMGTLAGFFGGRTDALISRFIELMLSLPTLPLLLVISGLLATSEVPGVLAVKNALGANFSVVLIVSVIALFGWMGTARLVRGEALKLRELEYMDAARALGAGNPRLMVRHMIPNLLPVIIVQATLDVGSAILTEAALSFLGFGIQPPVSTWGNMLSNAQEVVLQYPWIPFFPGLMILITVLAFNFLGDGLRDALDPRSKL